MGNYLLSYHGGHLADSEEGIRKVMVMFGEWFDELGSALVNRGNPIGRIATISGKDGVVEGGGANPVTGYTVIQAESLEAAVKLARGCPVVVAGQQVEIGETFNAM